MNILNAIMFAFAGMVSAIIANYLADALPFTRRISKPVCRACHTILNPRVYLLNHPCPTCGLKRMKRYLILLVLLPILFIGMAYFGYFRFQLLALDFLLITYMTIIIIIDLEHKVILNEVVVVGILICGACGYLLHGWKDTLLGGALGFLIMFALYLLGRVFLKGMNKLKGTDITEDALGFGDVNLGGLLGLLLGFAGIPVGLLIGILIGGISSAGYLLIQIINKRYAAYHALPYAPFLIMGALILLYFPG